MGAMLGNRSHSPPGGATDPWPKTLLLAIVAPAVLAMGGWVIQVQVDYARIDAKTTQMQAAIGEIKQEIKDRAMGADVQFRALETRVRQLEQRP
jgi:hypothetical protein